MDTPSDPYCRTEIRDGMRITWHQPIADGRRPRAARRRLPPRRRERPLPGDPDLRHLRQGSRLPGRLSAAVGEDGRRLSRRSSTMSTNKYQNWETTDPELLGAARLRGRARGFARRGLVARLHGSRAARARSTTSTSASSGRARSRGATARSACSASRTTRATSGASRACIRRISRRSSRGKARTTATATPATTAASCASSRSAGPSTRSRNIQYGRGEHAQKNPEHRRIGRGPGHALRRGAGEEPRGCVRGAEEASARRRVAPLAHGGPLARARRRCSPARTGAGRAYIRAATSTATPRRPTTRRSGSRPTATRTGRSSPAATASRSRSASSTTS